MNWFKKKPSKPEWVCRTCGQTHAEDPTDYGYSLPDEVWELGEEERQKHLDWATDLCVYDGRYFLRGVLEVPFQFREGRFGWGIWAEVSKDTFDTFHQYFEVDGSHAPREPGTIASLIPVHPDSVGLPLEVQFGPCELRPLFYVKTRPKHPLQGEQEDGLSEVDYHRYLEAVLP